MIALLCFVVAILATPFKSKYRLEAENAALRCQLIVLRRKVPGPGSADELRPLVPRWFPSILQAITIVQPETLVRWHRVDFWRYWCCKSRRRGGRPPAANQGRAPCTDPAEE